MTYKEKFNTLNPETREQIKNTLNSLPKENRKDFARAMTDFHYGRSQNPLRKYAPDIGAVAGSMAGTMMTGPQPYNPTRSAMAGFGAGLGAKLSGTRDEEQMMAEAAKATAADMIIPVALSAPAKMLKLAPSKAAEFMSAMAGVRFKNAQWAAKNPQTMLPEALGGAMTTQAAGEAQGALLSKAGLQSLKENTKSQGKVFFDDLKGQVTLGDEIVNFYKQNPGKIPPQASIQAVVNARQAGRKVTEKGKFAERAPAEFQLDRDEIGLLKGAVNNADEFIEKYVPGWRGAVTRTGQAHTKQNFQSFLPRSESGRASAIRTYIIGALGANALSAGAMAALGMNATYPAVMAGTSMVGMGAMSPRTYGLALALAGAGEKIGESVAGPAIVGQGSKELIELLYGQ